MNKLLLGIIILLVALLGVSSFVAWQLWQGRNPVERPTVHVTKKSPTPISQNSKTKKIAYVKENSIWIINSDGSEKNQLTQPSNSIIRSISWKNNKELSYIRCTLSCQLLTVEPGSNLETIETEQPQILTLNWNNAGNQLAYLYRLPDGQMKLDIKSKEASNTIKNFFAGPGRGGSLDDEVSIHFSPDDKHILVTNTLTTGNPQDKNTIWVLDAYSGKEVLSIPISEGGWPTQASWTENEKFIYKQGSQVLKRDISKQQPQLLVNIQNFYNPKALSDLDTIIYWSTTKTLPELEISGEKDNFPGFYKPQPLDGSHVIAIKAKKAEGEELVMPFISSGISVVETNSNEDPRELDLGEISDFAISP